MICWESTILTDQLTGPFQIFNQIKQLKIKKNSVYTFFKGEYTVVLYFWESLSIETNETITQWTKIFGTIYHENLSQIMLVK